MYTFVDRLNAALKLEFATHTTYIQSQSAVKLMRTQDTTNVE